MSAKIKEEFIESHFEDVDYSEPEGNPLEKDIKQEYVKPEFITITDITKQEAVLKEEADELETSSSVLQQQQPYSFHHNTYQCNFCDYKAVRLPVMQKHVYVKHDIPAAENDCRDEAIEKTDVLFVFRDDSYRCKLCDYSNAISKQMKRHVARVHTREKRHQCEICGKRFYATLELTKHTRIHTGEKPYKCTLCNFESAKGLSIHMKTHTGDKPHHCNLCDYKSPVKSRLKLHMRIHTGEKPFKCVICDYSCSHKYSLRKHMLKHTDSKPFQCELCDFKCNDKRNLQTHAISHV